MNNMLWRYRLWITLLALGLLAVGTCNSRRERYVESPRTENQKDAQQRVLRWLQEIRFQEADNPRIKAATTPPTYEAWLEEGKGFIGSVEIDILNRFLREGNPMVDSAQIAYALGWVGDRSSVPVLIQAVDDKIVRVRIEAATSLGRLGDARAVVKLCKAALKDSDANVRANAVSSLGRFDSQESRDCLEQALHDENAFVRQMAQRSLQELERHPSND